MKAGGRRNRGRAIALSAVAVVLAAGAGPFAQAQESSSAADAPVVLTVGTTVDLVTDNPFAVSAGNDWSVVTTQYDMMLKFDSETLSPAPSLATGCEANDDSTVWTCTLRDGLKWSDGSPLTSRDIAFSYRFIIDNKVPQYRAYFPFNPTFETPDDQTFIWKAEAPTFALDMPPWAYIVPQKVWEGVDGKPLSEIKAQENTPSIGSGPFTLTEWTQGQGWTMQKNPYFWGDEPVVDTLKFRVYSNQEAMTQALRNGEIDVADGLRPSLVQSVDGIDGVTVQKVVSDWWLNLAFNFGGQGPDADPLPALKDIDVRTAIEMAIDKQAIADKVYQGTATTGDTIIRPASAFWHLDIPADQEVPFSPEDAAAMLEEAGYTDTDGDGIREDPSTGEPLQMLIPASQDTTGAVEAGQLIVGYLKAIGIEVDLKPVTDAKMNDYWGAGNFDAYIWYWSGDPDPDYQLSVFTTDQCGDWSDGCFSDPTYDALYERQRGILNRNERLKVVQEAQQYLYDQVPGVVLAYPGWIQAYRSDRFEGWVPAPGDHGYLTPTYNYDSFVSVHPVASSTSNSTGSSSVPGWLWLAAIAVIAAGAIVFVRRGRRRDLDEA
ncbi:MAG: ABC transporter substrate-binding protein [Actinomycetota bacterium]